MRKDKKMNTEKLRLKRKMDMLDSVYLELKNYRAQRRQAVADGAPADTIAKVDRRILQAEYMAQRLNRAIKTNEEARLI